MRIWLDDERDPPRSNSWGEVLVWDLVARTAEEVLPLVEQNKVTFIDFDHDLGVGKTGYDLVKRIEELASLGMIRPIDWSIHSANPVGASNINAAMKMAWKFWREWGYE